MYFKAAQGLRPGFLVEQIWRLWSTIGQGMLICLSTLVGHRMCSEATRHLWPDFLGLGSEGYAQHLVRAPNLLPCPGRVVKWATQQIWSIGWGPKPIKTANRTPCPERATSSPLKMNRAVCWHLCMEATACRNEVLQDLSAGRYKPHHLLHP